MKPADIKGESAGSTHIKGGREMKIWKQRLAVLLSLAIVLTGALGVMPQTENVAQAATMNYTQISCSLNSIFIGNELCPYFQIEAGQSVPLGKIFAYDVQKGTKYSTKKLADLTGETYKADSTKYASISSAGVLKAKAEGLVKCTIKYKSLQKNCYIQVVKKNALGTNSSKYNTIRNIIKKIKTYKNKVTSKNCYTFSNLQRKLSMEIESKLGPSGQSGFITGTASITIGNITTTNSYAYKLVIPELVGFENGSDAMFKYVRQYNPVGTISSKSFKIKSVTAKKNSKSFTITLTKKVTAAQIFAIKQWNTADTEIWNDKTAIFHLYVKDKSTGRYYYARAVAREGSSKLTGTMQYMKFSTKKNYQLSSDWTRWDKSRYDWTRGKSFKAK